MIATNLALHAAIYAPNHATTDAGAVGIIIIYLVGFVGLLGLLLWIWIDTLRMNRREKMMRDRSEKAWKDAMRDIRR